MSIVHNMYISNWDQDTVKLRPNSHEYRSDNQIVTTAHRVKLRPNSGVYLLGIKSESAPDTSKTKCYVVKIGNLYVDARKSNKKHKFVNHSCSPNCCLVRWEDKAQQTRVSIVSTQSILAGEELTINYGNERWGIFSGGTCKCSRTRLNRLGCL
jgi:hypothetical protein